MSATVHAVNGSYGCDPLVVAQVLISAAPDGSAGDRDTYRITTFNGSNCTDHTHNGCRVDKSGAFQLPPDAPRTMYALLLMAAGRSCATQSDVIHVERSDGYMAVNVRR